ncbi:type II toxin-antitoxin system RelE/ParE family toxin [Chlorobaculum thiosulfatiphilum]|uniref:Type II toxin-antitoxin system RelE/ParE family toxin n=1 Tax=Chlorobaculum thiosulfatiphilum TaxID=115852 RepID=A0A5C4S610_CHLTI|nr:type II toxin-antitoxin system RelE/ParE family toxin [Chlorobaculum thiosulfatiphilum]TNJ38856.1 type II toxin-antitoxin system RelE/ParE family toxin [Chlorobaculum thiosulfatiphilum]
MSFNVRFTPEAEDDLVRLYSFLLREDMIAAEQALAVLRKAVDFLREFPFSCRKAMPGNPLLRELLVPFGQSGYVMLFEIESAHSVTVLAVRHQREDDYH